MDESVRAAMVRWPNVPEVYGWLSLSQAGEWRLHPLGDAHTGSPGEPIGNQQIREFIGRNYLSDDAGRWYFQNGPQRVFVRLDAAPYILQLCSNDLQFLTHNGLALGATDIQSWWLDDTGRLYAQTEAGPGLVAGRDVQAVLEQLRDANGIVLIERLLDAPDTDILLSENPESWLRHAHSDQLPDQLGFIKSPG